MIKLQGMRWQTNYGALLGALLLVAIPLSGQQPGAGAAPRPPAKNLKLLAADADIPFVMRNFNQALGVQCVYCHVQGDFASDANPKKDVARKMIAMVRQVDASFPSSAGAFPAGYHEVDCNTCHRGSVKPESKAPREFFNRNESLGAPPPVIRPGVNLKVLPPDTRVHGDGSVMHDFRDALNVDCGYCHGGGKPFETDGNPRKDIARRMIMLVRQINSNFPGTGVYPLGTQVVTCYTCHRGDTHPAAVSNARYDAPAGKP
jgi:photosynthetic reaction center cytochrome c subunit